MPVAKSAATFAPGADLNGAMPDNSELAGHVCCDTAMGMTPYEYGASHVLPGEIYLISVNSRQFWAVFFTKLRFNLRSEVSRTYLGYLWWLLEPVFFVGALYLVFGIFLGNRADGFLLFLIVGQVAFSWFSRSVSNSSGSLRDNKSLINQVAIQKIFFPMLTFCQDFVKQMVVFVAMLGCLLYLGASPSIAWWGLPAVIFTQALLTLAVGIVCCAIVPLVPDLRFLIATLLTVLMWGSGVFYSYKDVLLLEHQQLFLLNPIANLIKNYRQVLLDGVWPDWGALALISLFSLVLIVIMAFVFRRLETTFARLALQ